MWRADRRIIVLLGLSLVAAIPISVLAQDTSAVEELAQRTAEELVKRKPTVLLIAPRGSCNLDPRICQTFDSALRSDIQQRIPGIRFVGNAEAFRDLKRNGFLGLDAYDISALRLVAVSEGSEILVTEDLWWEKNGYSLRIDVRESKTGKRLVPFHSFETKIARSIPDSPENPMIITDPDANVSVIIFKGNLPPRFVYPGCDRCPDPKSIGLAGAVEAMGTITPQGKVQSVSIISSPNAVFTKAALEALQTWRFRPAVGTDGKAFATRVNLVVTFRR